MWQFLAMKTLVRVVAGVLAIGIAGCTSSCGWRRVQGIAGCTQTQVADTAKGAGGVIAETLVTTALDVAFKTNSSTRNLSDAELAQCRSQGSCLPLAQRKKQETDASIARSRRAYDQLVGYPESDLTRSFIDWKDARSRSRVDASKSTSIMFRHPPLRLPRAMPTGEWELQPEGAESN